MARKANPSGVRAKGSDRIQFDFEFNGVRYRPTLERIPNEGNLRRARKQLEDIRARIERCTFVFEEEFPDYRYKTALRTGSTPIEMVFATALVKQFEACQSEDAHSIACVARGIIRGLAQSGG